MSFESMREAYGKGSSGSRALGRLQRKYPLTVEGAAED
jgi:hypothetical protein